MSARLPRLPRLPTLAGATRERNPAPRPARLGRAFRVTQDTLRPYPDPPAWWVNSLAEWVFYYFLTEQKGYQRIGEGSPPIVGRSFYYQVSIPALGIFVKTAGTRIDFLIPQGSGPYQALAVDPYNDWTHGNASLDRLKRQVLLQQEKTLLIWIETAKLEAGDFAVCEQALRGIDMSERARRG